MKGKIEDLKVRIKMLDIAEGILTNRLKDELERQEKNIAEYKESIAEWENTIATTEDEEEKRKAEREKYWAENNLTDCEVTLQAVRELIALWMNAL